MRKYCLVFLLCCSAIPMSCSIFSGASPAQNPPIIRFVNLKFIYDFMINKSKDAKDLFRRKEEVIENLQSLEMQMKEGKTTPELALNYQRKKQLYSVLAKEEDEYKKKMSQRINLAMNDIAEETGVDYILNIGDEVIYGKKKYDITEDVIRQAVDIGKKSEPLSR